MPDEEPDTRCTTPRKLGSTTTILLARNDVRAVDATAERAARRLERGVHPVRSPQVTCARQGSGHGALLLWQHPERGLLSPATFILVAEETGLIEPIGQWVLRTACQRAKAWMDAGYPPLKVAVNISSRQLIHPREFARGISRILNATGLDPRFLELEMTESLLVQNAERIGLRRLARRRAVAVTPSAPLFVVLLSAPLPIERSIAAASCSTETTGRHAIIIHHRDGALPRPAVTELRRRDRGIESPHALAAEEYASPLQQAAAAEEIAARFLARRVDLDSASRHHSQR